MSGRDERPDGPWNAPPVAGTSQGRGAAPTRAAAPSNDTHAPNVEALRARAANAVDQQRARSAAAAANAPDPGRVLVSIPRHDGTQLRVSLHTFEGKPFARVAPWQSSDGGASWWPVKGKGATVKVRELASVAAALLDAIEAAANDDGANGPRGGR